jgi:hypothetical protein
LDQSRPLMDRRNALCHGLWVSTMPRAILSTREWLPQVVEQRELEDLSERLLASSFQLGVARTQVLVWRGKILSEEDLKEIIIYTADDAHA